MKFNLRFFPDEIQVTLTENLKLPVSPLSHPELSDGPADADPLQQIESLVRKFPALCSKRTCGQDDCRA